jgi:hypothetical protein
MSNLAQAQRVVDLAKDTIRYLSHLNNTTNLYRKLQVFYHQFLTSAIAVVFLASVHAPVRFSADCREEFFNAMELIKDLSAKSWVSKRLWRTIRSLKEVAPRLGLRQLEDDPHSSAALTMAGLATGRLVPSPSSATPFVRPTIQSAPVNTQHQQQQLNQQQSTQSVSQHESSGQSPDNGTRLYTEMSKIFEGYVGMNGYPVDTPEESPGRTGLPLTETTTTLEPQGTVFQQFREMF